MHKIFFTSLNFSYLLPHMIIDMYKTDGTLNVLESAPSSELNCL